MPHSETLPHVGRPIRIRNHSGELLYTLAAPTLVGASLRHKALANANFRGADLTNADFYNSDLGGADFTGATLDGAQFERVLRNAADDPIPGYMQCSADNRLYPDDTRFCDNCCHSQDDCECVLCERCGDTVDTTCSDCGRGTDCCCTCVRCDRCSEVTETRCDDCGQCDDCGHTSRCDSSDAEDGEDCSLRGSTTHPAETLAERRLFNCKRMAGAEVEYNSSSDFDPIKQWAKSWGAAVHEDGSCGWECVTSPAAGDHMVSQTIDLVRAMRNAGCKIDDECGIHVHVDARDFKWSDIEKLMAIYARVEPALFIIAGQHRAKSKWCVPVGARFTEALQTPPEDRKAAIIAAALTSDSRSHDYAKRRAREGVCKKDNGRYVALNLLPWLAGRKKERERKGYKALRAKGSGAIIDKYQTKYIKFHYVKTDTTVEFRLHRELHNLSEQDSHRRLVGWMKLLCRLVDYAHKASYAEIAMLPKNAFRALARIAPDCAPWTLNRLRAWRNAVKSYNRLISYSPGRKGNPYVLDVQQRSMVRARREAPTEVPAPARYDATDIRVEYGTNYSTGEYVAIIRAHLDQAMIRLYSAAAPIAAGEVVVTDLASGEVTPITEGSE